MGNQILFVQGAGEGVHDAWDDKLIRSLERELGEAYALLYPRMPDEAEPRYRPWRTALLTELDNLQDGAILIGHSLGGAILSHVLAERRPTQKLRAISLIAAPFIGHGGWQSRTQLRLSKTKHNRARLIPAKLPQRRECHSNRDAKQVASPVRSRTRSRRLSSPKTGH